MTQQEQEWYEVHLKHILKECKLALEAQSIDTIKDLVCWIRDTAYTALCAEYLHQHQEE